MKNMSEYDLNLSAKLKVLRKELKISLPQLVGNLNMTKSNYYKIERGERKIYHGQLMKIVEIANINPYQFLDLCDIPKNSEAPTFSVQELFVKLILVSEGKTEVENIAFGSDELEFMEKVKENFKKKKSENKA